MKHILFIHGHEQDKINLFSLISNELKKSGYKVTLLAFSRYERKVIKQYGLHENVEFMPLQLKKYYYSEKCSEFKKYSEHELNDMIYYNYNYNKINKYKINKMHYKKLSIAFLEYLKDLVESKKIDKIIMWNNSYIFDRIAWHFAKKNNVPLVIFEQGFFRPFTFTVDSKGVNNENSMPSDVQYYKNIVVDEIIYDEYFMKPITFNLNNFNDKSKYIIIIGKIQRILYEIIDRFYYSVLQKEIDCRIINLNIKSIIERIVKRDNVINQELVLPQNYIFIPFQVHDDSQIILNSSNIKSMEMLVQVIDKISELPQFKELSFVFKEHPVSKANYEKMYKKYKNNSKLIFLKNGNTKKLIENSQGIITVNSTVGIEALSLNKKVMTLGSAFFNIDGIVKHCSDINNIDKDIVDFVNSDLNKDLTKKFLYDLRFNYQKEFYWRNPSSDQIISLINCIENMK